VREGHRFKCCFVVSCHYVSWAWQSRPVRSRFFFVFVAFLCQKSFWQSSFLLPILCDCD